MHPAAHEKTPRGVARGVSIVPVLPASYFAVKLGFRFST
jgi:hypothetical protein